MLEATQNSHTIPLSNKNVKLKQVPYGSQTNWINCTPKTNEI